MSADDVSVGLDEAAVERACEVMHSAYEATAVGAGWETQQVSRKPWADVPEANKATMRAAVAALLDHLAAVPRPATQPEVISVLAVERCRDIHGLVDAGPCAACGSWAAHVAGLMPQPEGTTDGEVTDDYEGVRVYLKTLRSMNPSATVLAVADEIEAELPPLPIPSQPAHGEALSDNERDGLNRAWHDPHQTSNDDDALLVVATRIKADAYAAGLAAQPAHGDNEAALRAAGPFPCCVHCVEDDIHDVEPNGHEVPCTTCYVNTAAYAAGYRAALSASAEPEGGGDRG